MNESNKLKDVGEICCDDRFEIIARAKAYIIKATNIETSADEMKVLDNFLFRLWQLGWLNMFKVKQTNDFKKELTSLLNRYGWDGACETPDHILADYIERCLNNYCSTIGINIAWHNWRKLEEIKIMKKEEKWNYVSEGKLPERQENGVSDHVIVAVEGCTYGMAGYYDFDMGKWFVDGCSHSVNVYAWKDVKLPKVLK